MSTKFQPGTPKPANSGRKKGTPNKAKAIGETLGAIGFDIAEEAVQIFKDPVTTLGLRFKILCLLAEYAHIKPQPPKDAPDDQETARPLKDLSANELMRLVNATK